MTSKEYLQQIDRLDRMINNKLQEIYMIKTSICGISASNCKDRVQTSTDKDKFGIIVGKIVDMEKEVDALIDKRDIIVKQIEGMCNNIYYDILFGKYVLGKSFVDIAQRESYSYRQVTREHGDAIACFEKMYGNLYLNQNVS